MNNLNLIWQTEKGQQTDFEFQYITEVLFKNFKTTRILDYGSLSTIVNNTVIIYSNDTKNASPRFLNYLNKFRKKNFNFYLLHLSNENLNHDTWYYSKANYVFRNYFDPLIKNDNVLFIPLGFKSGFLRQNQTLNDCNNRNISSVFMGQAKAGRYELVAEIKKLKSHYIHESKSFVGNTLLSQDACIEIYQKTRYTPCPGGNVHPDSFRVCETLEWGCIPVVKKENGSDYFENIYGKHPFKIVTNWDELSGIVENEEDFCVDSNLVGSWYKDFKKDLQLKINNIIDNNGVPADNKRHILKYLNCAVYTVTYHAVYKTYINGRSVAASIVKSILKRK